jgi:hypothetical protein
LSQAGQAISSNLTKALIKAETGLQKHSNGRIAHLLEEKLAEDIKEKM